MAGLELTRAADDRRRFDLAGYGSVRKLGWSVAVTELTTLDRVVLRTDRSGVFHTEITATDPTGTVVGSYRSRAFSSSGDLTWRGQTMKLRSVGWFRARYELERDGRPLLRIDCKGWGRSPVSVDVEDPTTEAALVLFAVSVARTVVADSDAGGSAGATAAV